MVCQQLAVNEALRAILPPLKTPPAKELGGLWALAEVTEMTGDK